MTEKEFAELLAEIIDSEYEQEGDSYITKATEEYIRRRLWEALSPLINGE